MAAIAKMLTILDVKDYGSDKIIKYGVERLYEEFGRYLGYHNEQTLQMYSDLVQPGETQERLFTFGKWTGSEEMVDLAHEYGMPDATASTFDDYEYGLPLRRYGWGKQWTKTYWQRETVERFNEQLNRVLLADSKKLRQMIGNAIFARGNYTFRDRLRDGKRLLVYSLAYNDNEYIPLGPQNEEFDSATHTHYQVITAVNATTLKTVENNLLEHVDGGEVVTYINKAQEAAVRASTGFIGADDPRIIRGITSDRLEAALQGKRIHNTNMNDRFVGIIADGQEIWVKSWIPAGWGLSLLVNSVLPAPLTRRRDDTVSSDLIFEAPINAPDSLMARVATRKVGFGVTSRLSAVAWKVDAGAGAYTTPTVYAKP